MSEQIFLNGAPVVGFGDAYYSTSAEQAREKEFVAFVLAPLLGIVAGAGGGGVLGYKAGKGWGAAAGSLVGGVVGGIVGGAVSYNIAKKDSAAVNAATGVGTPPVAATGLPWGEFVASGVVTSLVGLAVEEAVRAVRGR